MVSSRRKDRKLVLEFLYENDLTDKGIKEILELKREVGIDISLSEFSIRLLSGILNNKTILDEIIEKYSEGWKVSRMPVVDRNILRIGVYELLFESDTPIAVCINEAVELAKVYSTDDARRFINGVLGRIAQDAEKIKEEAKIL
ncbi:MAG: transcription antitermination factor NusB [Actinobacteria bacterium]|nr:transcription antitermination factor NusB [Actinomycetota bacterium]